MIIKELKQIRRTIRKDLLDTIDIYKILDKLIKKYEPKPNKKASRK